MTDTPIIRTAIIDDHEAIRLGIGAALQQHASGHVRVVSSHEAVDTFLADSVDADVVMLAAEARRHASIITSSSTRSSSPTSFTSIMPERRTFSD